MASADIPIVIGAGPAGLAAAIQLRRHGIPSLVFEKDSAGGLLKNANLVENYPGFPEGISGIGLSRRFERQAEAAGVRVTRAEVESVACEDGMFAVKADGRLHYTCDLVVASGTKPRRLSIPGVPPAVAAGFRYEIFPLLESSGLRVVIVGAGDAAFDYALSLAAGNDVWILNRDRETACLPLLRERARVVPRIRYLENTTVAAVFPDGPEKLHLECAGPDGPCSLSADCLVGAIGREPQMDFLPEDLRPGDRKPGAQGRLHFAGDVAKGRFRQTAIAVGDGILAAMRISRSREEGLG